MSLTHNEIWQACLDEVEANATSREFQTWFKPIKPKAISENTLTIIVPNEFFYEYIEQHYADVLKDILQRSIGPNAKLKYAIRQTNKPSTDQQRAPKQQSEQLKSPFVVPGIKKQKIEHQLSKKYTFENFVEGACNRLAFQAGKSITHAVIGQTAFNPLVIYGDVGLGKTHLVHAIGNEMLQKDPDLNVRYTTTEKFTNNVIKSLRNNSTDDFVQFYQSLDLLIIDDIQFLAGRTKTQEIFFHVFNDLHSKGKQIILTADKAPKDMEGISERLSSRFKWGLIAELEQPDLTTRMQILELKLAQHDMKLDVDVMAYICHNIQSNIRELEGVVVATYAQAKLNNRKITLPIIREVIGGLVNQAKTEISLKNIVDIVAKYYNLQSESIYSTSRKQSIVNARQLSMYLSKELTDATYKSIGEDFGGKDHTTVMYSCNQVKNQLERDTKYQEDVQNLKKKIQLQLV